MYTPTKARNYHAEWPYGPLNYRHPRFAEIGPTLPPVTRADAKAGLRFQEALVERLKDAYPNLAVCPDWWLAYDLYGKAHKAGPDITIIDPKRGLCIVIECKLTYTDAYKQLFLYMSLLRSLLPHPAWTVCGLLAFRNTTSKPVIQSGDSCMMLNNPVELTRFKWAGNSLPLVGCFGSDFIHTPHFLWNGEPLNGL